MFDEQVLHAVLLPGIDGTGKMFGPLIEQLPEWFSHQVVNYPRNETLSYQQLAERLQARLPQNKPYIMISESFAGPLALMLSSQAGDNLKAIVLCATFLTNPRPRLSKLAPLFLHEKLVGIRPRKWMARMVIAGRDANDSMLEKMFEIHKSVSTTVIIDRLYSVIDVDVKHIFKQCSIPVLHLYGERDHLVLKYSRDEIRAIRPDIRSVAIDGPHLLLQTQPEASMQAIRSFLADNQLV